MIFIALCAFLGIIGIVLLYQKAQGRKTFAPRKDLTDALQSLKKQGKDAFASGKDTEKKKDAE